MTLNTGILQNLVFLSFEHSMMNDSVNILFFFWVYVGVLLLMISKLMVFVVSFAKAIVSDSNSSEDV